VRAKSAHFQWEWQLNQTTKLRKIRLEEENFLECDFFTAHFSFVYVCSALTIFEKVRYIDLRLSNKKSIFQAIRHGAAIKQL
jgi:hypothetical protein